MKLSEAIRLGAMLSPQGCEELRSFGTTCALGAASEAIGIKIREGQQGPGKALRERFPILQQRTYHPTVVGHRRYLVSLIITDLNDEVRWTREQIADWVEMIKSAQSVDAVDPVGEKVTG